MPNRNRNVMLGEEFGVIFSRSPVAMAIVDREARYLKVNAAYEATFGYSEAELLTKRVNDITHPEDVSATENHRLSILSKPDTDLRIEKRYITKTGEVLFGIANVVPMLNKDESLRFFIVTIQNINELKRANEALMARESELQAKTLASRDGFWDYRHDTGEVRVSARFWEMFGYAATERSAPDRLLEFIHGDDLAPLLSAYWAHVESRGVTPFSREVRVRHKDGHFVWVNCRGQVTEWGESGQALRVMGANTDITDLKNAQESLVNSSRMVALGEMAAGIAHEINNPLTIIKGYADLITLMLGRRDQKQSEMLDWSKQISATSVRMAKIISGLRRFAREDEFHDYHFYTFQELLDDAFSISIERLKSNGVHIQVEGDQSIQIFCNKVGISQVLVNLFNNSLYAIRNQKVKWITIKVMQSERQIRISVIDSGIGIARDIRSKIMLPFFTTKPPSDGSGLGLSVSRGIMESHKGMLLLDEDFPNTKFDLVLPRVAIDSAI